jgi:hypothetical protein
MDDGTASNRLTGYFNLSDGTASPVVISGTFSGAASISFVGNGWYRCTVVYTTNTTTTTRVNYFASNTTSSTTTGDGFSGIYIWGAQLEAAAFATSYIPTVASQVTRSADAASMTGTNFSSWYNAGEGTMYANFNTVASTNFPQVFNLSDGGSSNSIVIDAQSGVRAVVVVGGSIAALFTSSKTGSGDVVSLGYKVNDFAASFNGAASVIDTIGTLPALTTATIGRSGSLNNFLNGTIKKLAYYPIRCTNAQLQGLTS